MKTKWSILPCLQIIEQMDLNDVSSLNTFIRPNEFCVDIFVLSVLDNKFNRLRFKDTHREKSSSK